MKSLHYFLEILFVLLKRINSKKHDQTLQRIFDYGSPKAVLINDVFNDNSYKILYMSDSDMNVYHEIWQS